MAYDSGNDAPSSNALTAEQKLEIKFLPLSREDRDKINTIFLKQYTPSEDQMARIQALREQMVITAQALIQCCPISAERQMALMKLEEVLDFAAKAIVRAPE